MLGKSELLEVKGQVDFVNDYWERFLPYECITNARFGLRLECVGECWNTYFKIKLMNYQ